MGEGEGGKGSIYHIQETSFDFLKRVFCVQRGSVIKILCEEYFASHPSAHCE